MNTLARLIETWQIDPQQRSPITLPALGRNDLAYLFHRFGFMSGAEIGVERGLYSEVLCRANPGMKLYAVDPWLAYKGYREHVSQAKMDELYEDAVDRLAQYNCWILREQSVQAAELVKDGSLDFVYIDGNHSFLHVTQDLAAWSPKVRAGGIIAGHDYRRSKGSYECRVKDVVQAWTYAHGIRPWFVLTADKSPTWMWIRE